MTENKFYGGLWLARQNKPNSPALTGSIEINGKKYFLAMFKNEDRSNRKPDYNLVMQEAELKPANELEKPELD